MSSLEAKFLTKQELLEIERLCDQFETDQKSKTSPLQIDMYVDKASFSIQAQLRAELDRIQAEWNIDSATYRLADSTHGRPPISRTRASDNLNPPSAQSKLGQRFQFLDLLGQGSSGCVWKAFDLHLNRLVAIKLPHWDAPSHTDHFVREARAASRLNHPNIAKILEVGQESEYCFLLSELIEGGSLADRIAQGQITIADSIDLLIEVAIAIEYAHSMGIVHRDLKPHNILVGKDGTTKLVDFGLAKDSHDYEATLTQTGALVGTPAYMSPEQADGSQRKPEPTIDIYSLGVVFYQLLTGDVPFRGNPQIVLFQLLHSDPPAPILLDRNLPPELNTLCLKCLEKKPAHRFQTARELKEELIRFRDGHPIRSKPASFTFVAKKWIGRNRRLAGWIAASSLLMMVATVIASVSAVVVGRSWQTERESRLDAQNSAEATLGVLRLFESSMQSSDPVNALLMGGGVLKVASPISESQLDSVTEQLKNELIRQPAVRARLLDVIANVYRALGKFPTSQSLLDEATKIREQIAHFGLNDDIPLRDYMLSAFYKGWLEHDKSNWQSAENYYRMVLDGSPADNVRENKLFRADVLFQMGRLLLDAGKASEAKPFMKECLDIRTLLLPENATSIQAAKIGSILSVNDRIDKIPWIDLVSIFDGNDWVAKIGLDYAGCVLNRNARNYLQAGKSYALVQDQIRAVLPMNHPISLFALGDYAGFLVESGDYRKAELIAKELFELGNRICPTHRKLIDAKSDYAFELMFALNFEGAEKLYQEVLERQFALDKFPEQAHFGLAWCNLMLKKPEIALQHAKALWEHRAGKTASQVAWCAHTYARAMEQSGLVEECKAMDSIALREAVIELHFPSDGIGLERLSLIHSHSGDLPKAEKLLRDAVAAERRDRPPNHPRIADRLTSLANNLVKQEKTSEARELLNEALAIGQHSLPEADRRIKENLRLLKNLETPKS